MRLILVRHGRSTWNAEGRLQGIADPPLAPAGRAQARRLRALVEALAPEMAVSSDLIRAQETARLLGGPPALLDPRWRELDLGDWTGRLVADLGAADLAELERWRRGRATPPGGETWDAARTRVRAALAHLLESGARSALVVTHGGAIRASCASLAGLDLDHLAPVPNASLSIVDTEPRPHLLAYGVAPRPMPRAAPGRASPPRSG